MLLFERRTKEKVGGYPRMLEKMWAERERERERERLIESVQRNVLRYDVVT